MYDFRNFRRLQDHEDLQCSYGPVSSMPGSSHSVPSGSMCDEHRDRPAVDRIQGETDSFGCEYLLVCRECKDKIRQGQDEDYKRLQFCDWCKQEKEHCKPHRDMDEGMAGPLYIVCGDCRSRELQACLDEMDAETGMYDFDDCDDDGDLDDRDDGLADLHSVPYCRRLYRVRFHGETRWVAQRKSSQPAVFVGWQSVMRFINKHKGRLRGQRIVPDEVQHD